MGRQDLNLIVHHLAQRPDLGDYVNRVTGNMVFSKTRLNDGHGDNALAWGWALLGVQLSGNTTAAMVLALGTDKAKLRIQGVSQ